MRTLCCCSVGSFFFFSVSTRARTFLLAFVPSFLCLDGRDFRARLTAFAVSRRRRVRPFGRLARDWVSAQQSPQKQGSRPLFATASLELNGHDATGFTRPYRNPSLARIVYSISKTLRYVQGGILSFLPAQTANQEDFPMGRLGRRGRGAMCRRKARTERRQN